MKFTHIFLHSSSGPSFKTKMIISSGPALFDICFDTVRKVSLLMICDFDSHKYINVTIPLNMINIFSCPCEYYRFDSRIRLAPRISSSRAVLMTVITSLDLNSRVAFFSANTDSDSPLTTSKYLIYTPAPLRLFVNIITYYSLTISSIPWPSPYLILSKIKVESKIRPAETPFKNLWFFELKFPSNKI
jgi:hypothetical protein